MPQNKQISNRSELSANIAEIRALKVAENPLIIGG